ncbi:MAG: hypothetical protein Q7S57_03975 [bacterium]|nr:hypothetical protein [bacterium]
MKKEEKQKKVYRLYDEQESHPKLSYFQIFLRASVIFVFVFIMLCTVFVSAAILPIKVVVLSIPRGGSISIAMPLAKKNNTKQIEICRGLIKRTCTVLAKNVLGVKKIVKIPVTYILGDANIKISVTSINSGKTSYTLLSNKKVKIVTAKTSGGSGGGGGGSSGGGGGGSSSGGSGSSESIITLINGGVSTPTPIPTPVSTPSSSGTIIRATPTPTPPLYNTKLPVLINH